MQADELSTTPMVRMYPVMTTAVPDGALFAALDARTETCCDLGHRRGSLEQAGRLR